jgi:predicted permease
LAVAEVALAVMLAIGAGLMIRTMQHLLAIDPGFATESVLTLNFSIPRAAVPATPSSPASSAPQPPPAFVASSRELLEHVRAVPGVAAASLVSDVPLAGNSSAVFYAPEGDSTSGAQTMPRAYVHRIRPEFFETMRIPLRQGRTFEAGEMSADSVAVIVSEAVGRRFWPGQGAIGKRIKIGRVDSANPWLSIVGVVPDVKYRALPDNPTADPDLYLPFVDRGTHGLVLRTTVAPASVEAAVRAAVREVHPGVVVFGAAPLRDLADAQTAQQRFTSWLLSVFAMVALGLAVMGVYGVMAQLVAQRGREFGIRLALGASRGQILSLVLGGGTRLIGLGLVIGSLASLGARKVLGSLLYQTQPLDASAAVAVVLLAGAAFLATAVPAFRATRTDPAGALRAE